MHSQEDTLKILNCDKSTLSRYVKKGKLAREKKGRKTFYDEHEVAALVKEIEDNKYKTPLYTQKAIWYKKGWYLNKRFMQLKYKIYY